MAYPSITEEMIKEASRVLLEEKLVNGESVYKFEEEFAKFIGVDFAISTSSGTTALILINNNLIQKPGKILTTSHSFIATAFSIELSGHTPFFSDIDETGNIDLKSVAGYEINKLRAILPVHLHGNMANMDEIQDFANKMEVPIIEDACQAHGASYNNQNAGSIGEAAAFSFYSTKNLTVGGDGGMVTTNNEKLADKINRIKDNGRIHGEKYLHDLLGSTARLNTVNASIGRIQLKLLPQWNEMRRNIAQKYNTEFNNIESIKTMKITSNSIPVYHLYPILIENRLEFVKFMKENNIEIGLNYPLPIPDQPYYNDLNPEGSWEYAREWSSKVVCLPIHTQLSNDDVKRIIDLTLEFFT